MCLNAKVSLSEAKGIVAPFEPPLVNLYGIRQHTQIQFMLRVLIHNGDKRIIKPIVLDHDLGDDG